MIILLNGVESGNFLMDPLSYWYSVIGEPTSVASGDPTVTNDLSCVDFNVKTPNSCESRSGQFFTTPLNSTGQVGTPASLYTQDGLLPTPPEWMKLSNSRPFKLSPNAQAFKPSTRYVSESEPVTFETSLNYGTECSTEPETEVNADLLQALADLLTQSIEQC
jgi:hypothetical protein